jgi:GT2 family glycosyltransferase
VDCLLYGAAEMFLSPEVAIIQQSIGIMQVVGDYFENGMKYFQDLVYSAINFNVGNGEVPPFVGHNAFLRWEAVQSVGVNDPDGYVAYWSESHVSEDFDIALRLQVAGFVTRVANYHDNEFKEGVSLTIYDEISRWEKYSYGCTEIMFHPFKSWITKSPFTPLFRRFLFSDMILSSKFTILAYMTSCTSLPSS